MRMISLPVTKNILLKPRSETKNVLELFSENLYLAIYDTPWYCTYNNLHIGRIHIKKPTFIKRKKSAAQTKSVCVFSGALRVN